MVMEQRSQYVRPALSFGIPIDFVRLYIDQPVQTGLSYDSIVNGTQDLTDGSGDVVTGFDNGVPEQNTTFLVGSFPTQNEDRSANDTANAARSLWHFAQVWFQTFPDYKPNDDKISFWTESYGGHYGPAFMAFFQEQNQKIANGTWKEKGETYMMHLDTLGIINGCIDTLVQEPSYPHIAYNNTYGIKAINKTVYDQAMQAFTEPGGVRDLIMQCRTVAAESDPLNQAGNATVNDICAQANEATNDVEGPYTETNHNYYDIAAVAADPFPRNFYIGYLNQPHVQQALGVPVNYTNPGGNGPYYAFQDTGDYPRAGFLEDMSALIDNGVKVAMVYGDRDYACNWIGGEAVSLAVNYSNTAKFHSAGYTNLTVNSSYVGGLTRQYGNFSFSRIFQAGHEVPAYQPETAYRIFMRALNNMDIATGASNIAKNSSYATTGMADTWSVKDKAPEAEEPFCYTYALTSQCTDEQYESVLDGSALIKDYLVIDNVTTGLFPQIAAQAKGNSSTATSTGSGSSRSGGSSAPSSSPSSGSNGNGAAPVRPELGALLVLMLEALCFF